LLIIAKEFGRRHDTVLRSIDDLIKSGHIGQHEFVLTNYLIKTTAKRYQYSGNISQNVSDHYGCDLKGMVGSGKIQP